MGQEAEMAERRTGPADVQASQVGYVPQARRATIQTGLSGQARTGQQALAQGYRDQISGAAPSVAQMQLQQGQESAARNAMAMAASNPNVSPAQAQRLAQQSMEATGLATNQQAAQLRAQETAQAQQALGGLLSGMRGQDIGIETGQAGLTQQSFLASHDQQGQAALANAQMQQQAAMGNQGMTMQQQQQNDAMVQYYLSQGFTEDQAAQQAAMQLEQLNSQNYLGHRQLRVQQDINDANIASNEKIAQNQMIMQGIAGGASAVGGAIAASDERLKTNIKDADDDVREALDALNPKSWDYKDAKHGFGSGKDGYIGFMAQDAEKSRAGRAMVIETKEGKMIDQRRALALAMAATAHLNKRLKKLEGAKDA